MTTMTRISEVEVRQLVTDWLVKLDIHAPVEEMLYLLAKENLEMQLPEVTLHGLDEFKIWYDGVIHTFFDEVHTIQSLDITTTLQQAEVQLAMRWEASRWNAPVPNSERLAFDAAQRWVIMRSPDTQNLVINTYIVDALTPLEGFPNL